MDGGEGIDEDDACTRLRLDASGRPHSDVTSAPPAAGPASAACEFTTFDSATPTRFVTRDDIANT